MPELTLVGSFIPSYLRLSLLPCIRETRISIPSSGREVGEAYDHDGGVEGGGHGEEDGHGDVGARVVQEACEGDDDEEEPRHEEVQVGVERVGRDGGGRRVAIRAAAAAAAAVAVVREPVRPPARPPVVFLDLSGENE